jgi:thioredoxin reductase
MSGWDTRTEHVAIAIVGGGPSGLAAARDLARSQSGRVVVLDRECELGGIPRHANHQGYGLRDLHRSLSGPAYARRLATLAADAGAELRTGVQVTGWADPATRALEITSPAGRTTMTAEAVVLATGCRERPRSARLVAGSRPQGVMTTGMLQQLVYLHGEPVGRRAVIVGAEHVSFSALLTLEHGGARTVAMVTDQPRHQSYAVFAAGARARFRAPLLKRSLLTAIRGRRRVASVEITDLDTGGRREIECDTVIFTGDWVPDHELAVAAGVPLDRATRGPIVDLGLRTARPGIFAAGNLLHGAETADVAALSGAHVAHGVSRWLEHRDWPSLAVPVRCREPLEWIAPNAISDLPGTPCRDRFLLRAHRMLFDVELEVRQDSRSLWRGRVARVMPARSTRLPVDWTTDVDPAGGSIEIQARRARPGRRGSPTPPGHRADIIRAGRRVLGSGIVGQGPAGP